MTNSEHTPFLLEISVIANHNDASPPALDALDKYILHTTKVTQEAVISDSKATVSIKPFHIQFCSDDLSAFYLDIRKDVYTSRQKYREKAVQFTLWHILNSLLSC